MRTGRDNTYQTMTMVVSFVAAAVLTGLAIHTCRNYPQARIRERIEAVPVLAIVTVLSGRMSDDDAFTLAYIVGFGIYLLTIQWFWSVTLPGLYRRVFGGKGRSDVI